tara:strand:+ start:146 stop:370 length:225 start_codon:yes stop_codon:yes gene_type:complete
MIKLTTEQMRDVINALKHYQNHNISLNNPRYKEFDVIIATVENAIAKSKDSPQFQRTAYLEWAEESLSECIRGD